MSAKDRFLFYSDFNCPFCFALNERILVMGDSAKVAWRGIEHMPAASSQKSTLVDQTQLINEVAVVRKRAPEITLVTPPFRPSTRFANQLLFALSDCESHALSHLRTLIYRAYWQLGRDISDIAVLQELCQDAGLSYPAQIDAGAASDALDVWQGQWAGERFHSRLPAMVAEKTDKALLGFPTFDLLSSFFAGSDMPDVPESLASCEMKPKQSVLLVGDGVEARCDVTELKAAYQVDYVKSDSAAQQWLSEQSCIPDLILIDTHILAERAFKLCSQLRSNRVYRTTAVIMLLDAPDAERELAAFDAGATDVMFDLSNPKVCQARLDMHLRMKRSSSLLSTLARVDYLTELPNRREYDRKLEDEWLLGRRAATELSVVLIDIDHFKNYNDNYGHSMGDDCLRQVARAMVQCLHRPGDMLARYGGEEFVAVLPGTPLKGAVLVAQAMVDAVRNQAIPHAFSSAAEVVTISAGVSTQIPDTQSIPLQLGQRADKALYEAKDNGRNRVKSHV